MNFAGWNKEHNRYTSYLDLHLDIKGRLKTKDTKGTSKSAAYLDLHLDIEGRLKTKDTIGTSKSAAYLDLHLDKEGRLKTKLYFKRENFSFLVVM